MILHVRYSFGTFLRRPRLQKKNVKWSHSAFLENVNHGEVFKLAVFSYPAEDGSDN